MAVARPEGHPEPREPRETVPEVAPPAPPVPAPTLVYDPGSRESGGGGLGNVLDLAQTVFTNPVGVIVGGFTRLFGGGGRSDWRGQRIVADSGTGKVQVVGRESPFRGRASVGKLAQTERTSLQLLQQTFDTGLVQPGIAPWYQDFAASLAQFRIDLDRAATEPGRHVPPPIYTGPGEVPPAPIIEYGPESDLGAVSDVLSIPVDLRGLYMTPTPFMPFSGLAAPRAFKGSGTRRRRKKKARTSPQHSTRKRASAKRPARLVKGSAAAKRYMAKLRRMRK